MMQSNSESRNTLAPTSAKDHSGGTHCLVEYSLIKLDIGHVFDPKSFNIIYNSQNLFSVDPFSRRIDSRADFRSLSYFSPSCAGDIFVSPLEVWAAAYGVLNFPGHYETSSRHSSVFYFSHEFILAFTQSFFPLRNIKKQNKTKQNPQNHFLFFDSQMRL
jgi:hypothetical protein